MLKFHYNYSPFNFKFRQKVIRIFFIHFDKFYLRNIWKKTSRINFHNEAHQIIGIISTSWHSKPFNFKFRQKIVSKHNLFQFYSLVLPCQPILGHPPFCPCHPPINLVSAFFQWFSLFVDLRGRGMGYFQMCFTNYSRNRVVE